MKLPVHRWLVTLHGFIAYREGGALYLDTAVLFANILHFYATIIYAIWILEWSDRQMQSILIGLSDKHRHQRQFLFQQNQFIVT